jgi:hypothetical protein
MTGEQKIYSAMWLAYNLLRDVKVLPAVHKLSAKTKKLTHTNKQTNILVLQL